MDRPGEKLKRARERLQLTFRDVADASQQIAGRRDSDEFSIGLSRLADIENKGTVPSIYRLYSLCAIYRLDMSEVLEWYGIPRDMLSAESAQIKLASTHVVQTPAESRVTVPVPHEIEVDLNQTTFLSQVLRKWGKMPLGILNGLETKRYRYGFIGTEDWSMHPVLPPGSFVAIDQGKRKIVSEGWSSEFDRPIYFLEHRGGYSCGWCGISGESRGKLVVQHHPSSDNHVEIFDFPRDIEVVGQVVGVAMPMDARRRRRVRTATAPTGFPDL